MWWSLAACELFDGDRYADTGDPYGLHGGDGTDPDDSDSEAQSNNDGHLAYETGVAVFMYAGNGKVQDGSWVEGQFGNIWWGTWTGETVCSVMGDWSMAGPAPSGCYGCDWAFELRVDATVAEGSHCDDLAPVGAMDGAWDNLSYPFGFATEWAYSSGMNVFYLENTILLFSDSTWFPFAYNFYSTESVSGSAEDFEFLRPVLYEYAAYYR